MNKLLTTITAFALCFALTGCGDTGGGNTDSSTTEEKSIDSILEDSTQSDIEQKEYLDITANEIMIPKSCCAELSDKRKYYILEKEYNTYIINVNKKYTIIISFEEIDNNSIGWTSDEMEEECKNLFLLSVVDNYMPYEDDINTPCDISSESINRFDLFTLKYEDKIGYIACREYNGYKYTIDLNSTDFDRTTGKQIPIQDCYDDFKDLLSNIKIL